MSPERKPASSSATPDVARAARIYQRRAAILAIHLSYVDPQQYRIALREIKVTEYRKSQEVAA